MREIDPKMTMVDFVISRKKSGDLLLLQTVYFIILKFPQHLNPGKADMATKIYKNEACHKPKFAYSLCVFN